MEQKAGMPSKKSEKCTFIIQIQYRQNTTWQGKIVWVESNKEQHFRSALELMTLMDSALGQEKKEVGRIFGLM